MDGRQPNEMDYDFKSSNQGADSLRIASNDTFWVESGWNTSAGVVVVIGVKQLKAGNYSLILTSPKTAPTSV